MEGVSAMVLVQNCHATTLILERREYVILLGIKLSILLSPFQLQNILPTKQMNKTLWSTEERKCIHPQTFSSFSCTLPFIKGVVLFVMVWITQSTYKINLQQSTNASSGYQAEIRAQQNTQMNKRNTCQQNQEATQGWFSSGIHNLPIALSSTIGYLLSATIRPSAASS